MIYTYYKCPFHIHLVGHPGIVNNTDGSGSISCLLTGGPSERELLLVGLLLSLSNDVLELYDDTIESAGVLVVAKADAASGTATDRIKPVA